MEGGPGVLQAGPRGPSTTKVHTEVRGQLLNHLPWLLPKDGETEAWKGPGPSAPHRQPPEAGLGRRCDLWAKG